MLHSCACTCIDGQYLASRLSNLISKTTVKLKSTLDQLNSLNIFSITWEDVSDLSSHIWYEGALHNETIPVPLSIKLKAIEIYHTILRCDEEALMLSNDMDSVIAFYLHDHSLLKQEILKLNEEQSSQYNRGCLSLLHQAIFDVEQKLIKLQQSFNQFTHVSLPVSQFISSTVQQHSPSSPEPSIAQQQSTPWPSTVQQQSPSSPEPSIVQQQSPPWPSIVQQQSPSIPEPSTVQQQSPLSPEPSTVQQHSQESLMPTIHQHNILSNRTLSDGSDESHQLQNHDLYKYSSDEGNNYLFYYTIYC